MGSHGEERRDSYGERMGSHGEERMGSHGEERRGSHGEERRGSHGERMGSHGERMGSHGEERRGSYREHLRVPVSWWLLAVPVIAVLGAEVFAGFGGFIPPLIYAVFTAVVAGFLLAWGAASIEVSDGALRAGGATLALREVGDVVPLDEKQAALLRGPRADPAAHLMLRPYLKRAVYIALAEPADGVPYWLVATRHPAELATAIERSRQTVG